MLYHIGTRNNTTGEECNTMFIKYISKEKNAIVETDSTYDKKSISPDPVIAIVLDRGVPGNNLDLLTSTEEYASKYIGRSTITYDALRIGW